MCDAIHVAELNCVSTRKRPCLLSYIDSQLAHEFLWRNRIV